MFNNQRTVDLHDVRHIERIVIGKLNPTNKDDENTINHNMQKLNDLLNGTPKGIIIGKDISCKILQFGEHQLVCQQVAFIVGFKRKPIKFE